jgi:uncharacterized protein YjiS (DUF1127 family)
MDTGLLHKGAIGLNDGEILRLRDAKGRHIGVVHGTVWVTQEGDQRDYVVRAGEHFRFDRGGLALVRPLNGTARLVFEDGLVPKRKAEPQIISVTRYNWFAHLPELERRARRMRNEAIGQAFATLRRGLTTLWDRIGKAVSAAIQALETARELPELSDSTLKDIGLYRDQIDRITKTLHGRTL